MARQPKVGPPILRIELLSSGIDPTLRDDLSGKPLSQPNARPPKVQDAQVAQDRDNILRQQAKLVLLDKLTTPKPSNKPFKRRM
jgi:hypothetical protein